MKKYNNPAWEPYFSEISPILSKLYFATEIGFIRQFIAKIIFKKIGNIEKKMDV